MTTLTVPTTTTSTTVTARTGVLRPGLKAAAVAAVATTGFAAVTHAAGVSYAIKGEAIPVLGFGQMTFLFSLVGIGLAVRARAPCSSRAVDVHPHDRRPHAVVLRPRHRRGRPRPSRACH